MNRINLLMGIFIALAIVSCKDDDPATDPATVSVEMEMVVGEESLVHGQTYSINNVDVQFTNVAYYVGDLTFTDSENSSYTGSDRYLLLKPGVANFGFSPAYVENGPEISLTGISFIVGVDPTTNAETEIDFTMRSSDDPLGQQNPTMHWGWQGGYRFLNIDANADLDGDGDFETPLTYHLGKDDFLGNVSLTVNEKLEGGQNDFRLLFDMEEFLSGIDFSTEQFTKVQPDNLGLAQKLLTNYNSSFSLGK